MTPLQKETVSAMGGTSRMLTSEAADRQFLTEADEVRLELLLLNGPATMQTHSALVLQLKDGVLRPPSAQASANGPVAHSNTIQGQQASISGGKLDRDKNTAAIAGLLLGSPDFNVARL
jgi:hypothetical protein